MASPSTSISWLLGCVQTAIYFNILLVKVGSGGNLGLRKEYFKELFGPIFYSCCNCPLSICLRFELNHSNVQHEDTLDSPVVGYPHVAYSI